MQMLSALLAAIPDASRSGGLDAFVAQYQKLQESFSIGRIILWFVIGQLVVIIANLIASKAVAEDYQVIFPNAVRVWILHCLVGIAAAVLGAIAYFVAYAAGATAFLPILILIIGFAALIAVVRVPMTIYRIDALQGLGFVLLAWLITALGNAATSFVAGPFREQVALLQAYQKLSPQDRARIASMWTHSGEPAQAQTALLPGEAEARDKTKTLPERAAGLKRMYGELETVRLALKPEDAAARQAYRTQKARYEALLEELRNESAANQRATAAGR